MSLPPLVFTGVSQFSADFQTIMDRAVRIAQIPIQGLQNRDSDILQQKALWSNLSSGVSGMASSLASLGEISEGRALAASSSNSAAVSVVSASATNAASYTINFVSSIATAASERTLIGYADSAATPVSSTGSLTLEVGDEEYTFTLTNNTLVGLRDKINALGAGVTASILTTTEGNYLSVSTNATGATTLALHDDPEGANENLITASNQGSNAVFQLNGIDVEQSSNLVNGIVPGLTFSLVAETNSPVTLTLATDRSKLSGALRDFVAAYNATRTQINEQVGPAAGLLSGHVMVRQLQTELRQIASYRTTTGSVKSLTDLGITFDTSGKAFFDDTTINAFSETQLSSAFEFAGTASLGLGGFSVTLRQSSDPVTGLIRKEQDGLDRVDRALQDQMAALTERIVVMRAGLAIKLQQADTLLATLESQQNTLKASLQGLNSVLYGRNLND